ncbi:MAG: DUF2157 domain-containing protein [Phyllobacteriaceae bacterium]|nr:DUF2157 domain-containing protein [Phyllobacteriaceae bacterium]
MNENVIDPREALAGIRLDRRAVDRLAARGVVDAAAWARAVAAIEPPRRWGVWAGRLLTTTGTALVLAGVVWFFASNWNRMPPFAKLGAIAAMIAAACLVVVLVGFGRWISQAAGSAAIVLVGVFLAVEGQIHQTGADAWMLFAAWAVLTLPWALLLRSAAAWTIWLAVADLAVLGWFDQTMPADVAFHARRTLILLLLHGGFLVAREVAVARGVDWPSARWTRFVLALPMLAALAQTGLMLLDRPHDFGPAEWTAMAAIPLIFAALFAVYCRRIPDVALLAAVTMVACGLADFTLFRLMTGGANDADLGVFFLMGLATLGLFALAVAWLRRVARDMEVQR